MPNVTHTFQSAKADSADATLIQPSNWNAVHTVAWDDQYFTAAEGDTSFTPTFTLSSNAWVFVNGVKQRVGTNYDYTQVSGSVVFNFPLKANDIVEIIQ